MTHSLALEMNSYMEEQLMVSGWPSGYTDWKRLGCYGGMTLSSGHSNAGSLAYIRGYQHIRGVTAHEVCLRFFEPRFQIEWLGMIQAIESSNVVEGWVYDPKTYAIHHVYPNVPILGQRDALFGSAIRCIEPRSYLCPWMPIPHSVWMVVNKSIERSEIPSINRYRVTGASKMICQTHMVAQVYPEGEISRSMLYCNIFFESHINLGGYMPPALFDSLFKQNFPNFVHNFMDYCRKIRTDETKPFL